MKMPSLRLSLALIVTALLAQRADSQLIERLRSDTSASFRGVSVVSAKEVWISGSDGTVIRSTNTGKTFSSVAINHSNELDFRDIEVLPDGSVLLMSIGKGESSKLLRSADYGKTWTTVLQNHDEQAFFDGVTFHRDGKRGALFGDPIENRMDLYLTEDAGKTWNRLPKSERPPLVPGEVGFAASGTGIAWTNDGLWIATGGTVARIHRGTNQGRTWTTASTPLLAGRSSAGIFSMAVRGHRVAIVGGDYRKPNETGLNVAVSNNSGTSFRTPQDNVLGHKACVKFLDDSTIIACGRTGVDLSKDGGRTWRHLTDEAYYTMDVDTDSGTVYFAGPKGAIARMIVTNQ
jgi:photosystem II stability/assembly factor-like uncharacterized protein